eukprot:TRINITY_DN17838_c0_g1_i1.p2 TRINITY_DN17838_c0_g1~~TRINITY_DN17838_c0_g1_i1.p2  ORF type:complete len:159 (+),score=11.52 TRINITY_DN17838_c0_g1_i1:289-765(+)
MFKFVRPTFLFFPLGRLVGYVCALISSLQAIALIFCRDNKEYWHNPEDPLPDQLATIYGRFLLSPPGFFSQSLKVILVGIAKAFILGYAGSLGAMISVKALFNIKFIIANHVVGGILYVYNSILFLPMHLLLLREMQIDDSDDITQKAFIGFLIGFLF